MKSDVLAPAERPRLELSGPKLAAALERLVAATDGQGGVERYALALQAKAAAFRELLVERPAAALGPVEFRTLAALCATVRRRIAPYLEGERFLALRAAVVRLLGGREDTASADARVAEFRAAFPGDRAHRWTHDLAAEILHAVDPERYPLMCRWVWDEETNTGVLREIWYGENLDSERIAVPSRYATFLVLREELAQYLAANGVYRDVLQYVDLLLAQVYADYIAEQGGTYLRADFNAPEDPALHVRRLLGLDAVGSRGRLRVRTEARAERRALSS
ncbi:MAG: hypothetical protein RML56_06585 [Burkholderiales bacterium]|nr:hypothetical protein [Burkholderiales bacterium]